MWPKHPIKPVFVVCTLRTGSNLLVSYLNSVPGVSIAGEILHPDQIQGVPRSGISKQAVMRHIRLSLNQCRSEICGAKLPSIHLQFHGLDVRQLHDYFPTAKVILLYRRSLADQYLSFQVARASKRWRSRNGQEYPRHTRLMRLDRDDFMKYCRQLKNFYSTTFALDGIRDYTAVLSYEELAGNANDVFNARVFPFLGLAPAPISTTEVKGMKGHPSEVVEDFDSVRDFWEDPAFIQDYR
jgi:LPS sulfotransferase NodH